MKNTIFYLTTLIILISCSNKPKLGEVKIIATNQKETTDKIDTIPESALWADDYIIEYLEVNKGKLTEVDGVPVSYMKETTTRKGRKYARIKIGHSFEYRYVTDQWLFIDSLTKEVFEYNLALDSLMLWSNSEKRINPTGTYLLDSEVIIENNEQYGYTGRIQVKLLSENKIVMSFGIMNGVPSYNSASFIDTLEYANNVAIYTTPDFEQSCKITFWFTDNRISVKEETDDYNSGCGFGHGVVADGQFLKESSEEPELRHYITDEIIE